MVHINAIQTEYNGYSFRSRTEARWAVFFDMTGTKYIYEEEGFNLPKNGRYLPDFYLTDLNAYIEIKGVEPTSDELSKCSELCEITKKDVFILAGVPGCTYAEWFRYSLGRSFFDGLHFFEAMFRYKGENGSKATSIARQYKFGRIA